MPDRYTTRILRHLADSRYEPRSADALAADLGVADDDLPEFRTAVGQLLEEKQLVLGSRDTLALPPLGSEMEGVFRRHERGFGFIVPDELRQHGDLFVPPGKTGDAMTGDRVRAKVIRDRGRGGDGRSPFVGHVREILQRADKQYVGTLQKRGSLFVVQVDGRILHDPVIVRDPDAKNAKLGDKVVLELIEYPDDKGGMGEGVITEVLGESGEPDVETLSIMRAYGFTDRFPKEVLADAREAARSFDDTAIPEDRLDLTDSEETFILTIDPPDAKDFDDAINIRRLEGEGDAVWELGVHIADVAHFIQPASAIDREAYERGNSTYLPRKVVPMLPEILSNGVCSLQPDVNRFAKSCFIRYNAEGHPLSARFAKTVIRSAKRLTYLEAQALIDGDIREARKHAKTEPKYPRPVVQTLQLMDELAKTIRKRRFKEGMIVLGLPEVELIYDDSGRVVDATQEDDAFTHTIIEMFMVEANEASARVFSDLDIPMIRRIHPDPDAHGVGDLKQFARVAGFNIPKAPNRHELQALLDSVRGKPAQHAVHLAVLRTLSKAEYAPQLVGHFALASEHYAHFTSPIRRYPDLILHRALNAYIDHEAALGGKKGQSKTQRRKRLAKAVEEDPRVMDLERLEEAGRHCSSTERNSESAERELRNYLVLEMLSGHLGEDFAGTVTGVSSQGVFMQIDRYLVDGFIRIQDLPGGEGRAGERWRLNRNTGALVAQRSGNVITIGNKFTVRIANVDLNRRQMELVIVEPGGKPQKQRKKPYKGAKQDGEGQPTKRRLVQGGHKKKNKKKKHTKGGGKSHGNAMALKRSRSSKKRKKR